MSLARDIRSDGARIVELDAITCECLALEVRQYVRRYPDYEPWEIAMAIVHDWRKRGDVDEDEAELIEREVLVLMEDA